MIDVLLTFLLLLIIIFVVLYNSKFVIDNDYFLSAKYTMCLKGLMCLIVVFVHIPNEYSNIVQDCIGSFAYICVSLFFAFSAYGLMYGKYNKKDYIKDFPKKRILTLLIPFFICNIISLIVKYDSYSIFSFILRIIGFANISFILVLLIYYVLFYFVHLIFGNHSRIINTILIISPILYSIITYYFKIGGWSVETLGLSIGLIIFLYKNKLVHTIKNNSILYCILFTILSLIFGLLYLKFKSLIFVGDYLLKIILGLIIIFLLFNLTFRIRIENVILKWLGSISYEIYLIHGIVIFVLLKYDISSSFMFIYLTFIFSIIFALVLHKFDLFIIKYIKNN